jgi:hypothetical protein
MAVAVVAVDAGGVGFAVGWLGKLALTVVSAGRDVAADRQAATQTDTVLALVSSRTNVRRVITEGPPLCVAAWPTRVL